jgi:hypothetical protein
MRRLRLGRARVSLSARCRSPGGGVPPFPRGLKDRSAANSAVPVRALRGQDARADVTPNGYYPRRARCADSRLGPRIIRPNGGERSRVVGQRTSRRRGRRCESDPMRRYPASVPGPALTVEPDDLVLLADDLAADEFDALLARPAAGVELLLPDYDPADDAGSAGVRAGAQGGRPLLRLGSAADPRGGRRRLHQGEVRGVEAPALAEGGAARQGREVHADRRAVRRA